MCKLFIKWLFVAAAPNDYTSTSVVLTFPAGAQSATVFVPIADDGINERQESFTATLSSPSGGATLGPNSTATVTIPNPQRKKIIMQSDINNCDYITL